MQDCIAAIASVHRKDRPREKKQISRFIHMFTYVRQIPPERQFLCPTPQVHCLDTTEENGWVTKPCLCVCVCVCTRTHEFHLKRTIHLHGHDHEKGSVRTACMHSLYLSIIVRARALNCEERHTRVMSSERPKSTLSDITYPDAQGSQTQDAEYRDPVFRLL